MNEQDRTAARFQAHRGELRAVAYRMLGSASEAGDAIQETWLRLDGVQIAEIENLAAWLRTVLSRICLNMLRSRAARAEPVGDVPERVDGAPPEAGTEAGPEADAVLADSVGRALLVVLDTLTPVERIAFVLHDGFAVPFHEIAPVLGRSLVATKKLASRARHKVRGTPAVPEADLARNRHVVEAFLDAARGGNLPALLEVLAPDVVRRADAIAIRPGTPTELRGSEHVIRETLVLGQRARFAQVALIDGEVGVIVAPVGRLQLALTVRVEEGRIREYDVIADPARLRRLTLAVLDR